MIENKRGQLAIFIIIAVVIAAVLIILFYPKIRTIVSSSPQVRLQDCMEDSIQEALKNASLHGGSMNPVNAIYYNGEKIEYLCYTNQYYQTCSIQQPLLRQHVEREILQFIGSQARKCVDSVKADLQKKGYRVSSSSNDVSVQISPDNLKVIFPGITISGESGSENYDRLEIKYKTKIYDLIMLTTSILNWEAHYGDADTTTYMLYYPKIKVEKYKQEDGSKIYILTHESKDKFVFATRSLSWPPGYGLGQTYIPVKV
ncbi:hypothetical protein HYW76_03135 [Candidatus Pacearchaeota archaeon]|nr:hypothetical protein [Candidatus Pacearchaeota archaeon]